jgi:hypothetical protein
VKDTKGKPFEIILSQDVPSAWQTPQPGFSQPRGLNADGHLTACGGLIPICLTTRQGQAVDDLWGFKTIISAMDQQSEAVKKLEDKIKILEDKVDEMERSLKQR